MTLENLGTIWVCACCMLNHANGECGCQGNDDNAHTRSRDDKGRYDGGTINGDGIPLSQIGRGHHVAMGMGWEDHSEDCLTHVTSDLKTRFPDLDWPDAPDDYECDCETDTFSRSQCDGCGTYLHGERHALTLFKSPRPRRRVKPAPVVEAPAPSVDELVALIDSSPWEGVNAVDVEDDDETCYCGAMHNPADDCKDCGNPPSHCLCCAHCGKPFGH